MTLAAPALLVDVLLVFAAITAPPVPADSSSKTTAELQTDKPQTCAQARQAQATAADAVEYPKSYRSADELRAEIQKHVELLCDEPVGDYGSRSVWEQVDKPAKKAKDPKRRPSRLRPPNQP